MSAAVHHATCLHVGQYKDRVLYDKKMAADKKTIERLCEEYNKLIHYGTVSVGREAVQVGRCLAADFPWAAEERAGAVPFPCTPVHRRLPENCQPPVHACRQQHT